MDFHLSEQATTQHAAFELYGRYGSLSAFETGDVQGEVDFEARTGEFVPNSGQKLPLSCPFSNTYAIWTASVGSWMMMKLI